jgi:two-component SAPR family response regulator
MKETQLISAFPGTGKSYYYHSDYMPDGFCLDSDSSTFDKSNFPANYIEHIKNNIGVVRKIFISSHKEVRDALVKNNLDFILVYPKAELKQEYLQRYINRGSSESFISLIDKNWDNWIKELKEQENCKHIELESGQFISNVL